MECSLKVISLTRPNPSSCHQRYRCLPSWYSAGWIDSGGDFSASKAFRRWTSRLARRISAWRSSIRWAASVSTPSSLPRSRRRDSTTPITLRACSRVRPSALPSAACSKNQGSEASPCCASLVRRLRVATCSGVSGMGTRSSAMGAGKLRRDMVKLLFGVTVGVLSNHFI
ncbi:hypothetical protein D3C76_1389730 [compost metagenome]